MKKFKQVLTVLALVALVLTSALLPSTAKANEAKESLKVAIIQLVSHPSLDLIHQGIEEGLAAEGYQVGENLEIDYQNAEGDMNLLSTIAQQVVSSELDYIFAITTPVAQALQNETKEIPIIMAGITDPESVNLVESLDQPGGNISGISDKIPHDVQFKLLQEILPDAKKVGLIYTTSEDNSEAEMNEAKQAAESLGLEVQLEGISSALDMQMVAENLASQVDAIFVGSDNTIASAFESLLDATDKQGIPVFTSVEPMVAQGALAGEAMSQKEIGLQAAKFLKQLVDSGQGISQTPVAFIDKLETVLNQETADRLKLEIPKEILDQSRPAAKE
ncbi:ABC transporter substrate binding protein [Hutsoniella sourekii]